MEFIKNVRDNNTLNKLNGGSNNWLYGLADTSSDLCWFGNTCKIDSFVGIPNGVTACSGGFGSCANIKQNTDDTSGTYGLFGYTASWTDTNFKREIQFQSISANEILVTISISWLTRGVNHSFQVSESLFNRQ